MKNAPLISPTDAAKQDDQPLPHDSSALLITNQAQLQVNSEAAQDEFQTALTSFQTDRNGPMNLSRNGLSEEDVAVLVENTRSLKNS